MAVTLTSTKRETHFVKLSVYGQAGAGKTVLCSTAPKPLIVSAEAGLLSLAGKDIPVIEIKTAKELKEAYAYVKAHVSEYETICLDSISDIAEQVLDNHMSELQAKAESEGKNYDPRQAYGKLAMEMMSLTRAFRTLPAHIVFTAKMGYVTDEVAKVTRFGPMLPGQVYTQNYPYLVDLLLCLRVNKDGTRYLQCQPDLQYHAKDRSGKLAQTEPVPLNKPVLADLFNKVMAKGCPLAVR